MSCLGGFLQKIRRHWGGTKNGKKNGGGQLITVPHTHQAWELHNIWQLPKNVGQVLNTLMKIFYLLQTTHGISDHTDCRIHASCWSVLVIHPSPHTCLCPMFAKSPPASPACFLSECCVILSTCFFISLFFSFHRHICLIYC